MKDIYQGISTDPGRIEIIDLQDRGFAVSKKTQSGEVTNMVEFSSHLQRCAPFVWKGQDFKVVIPEILGWDNKTEKLTLKIVEGNNLESLLHANGTERDECVDFLANFMQWMSTSGTFWKGLAPRHILIDETSKQISLLDFERPLLLKSDGYTSEEFNNLLRGLVHEEFCAFLFDSEQNTIFPNMWDNMHESNTLQLDSIHGKRVKLLLEKIFGPLEETVTEAQLNFIYKYMSAVVTPYFVDGKAFYPLVAIDKKVRGAENYANLVLTLSKIEKSEWPNYLKDETS